ncbi:hypothetical protein NC653_014720 [Populus alba x Populus x berolinensis]|uniref:Uncharacterized protein n=1 Tax=Populus alba x Populus x berolinensis TaxID=444605 RepID=A0AAD6QY39_9ROSI|nr:hypothetical protein NC653_014720 [Populus alba x Populus x berolinensis]
MCFKISSSSTSSKTNLFLVNKGRLGKTKHISMHAMHQAGTQFWQKTRSIPRSLALLTLAMASNSSIRQSEELKWI